MEVSNVTIATHKNVIISIKYQLRFMRRILL